MKRSAERQRRGWGGAFQAIKDERAARCQSITECLFGFKGGKVTGKPLTLSKGVFQYEELPESGITVSHGLHSHPLPIKH